jgi:hypothetical protein
MIRLKIEDVNKRYSQTWVKCNDDAQSKFFRKKFIEQFGGEFIKEGREHKWQKIVPVVVSPRRKLVFEGPDGKIHFIENLYDFCKKNDLNRTPMYDLMTGKRKQYKKYKFIAEIPWQV